ncbi:MAG: 7-cyano-7-deazaguanine synthase [Pseudomonadota bacterium]
MKKKAFVLLSGGLDSVFNLYQAVKKWPGGVEALFFNYGQRAYQSEARAARYFAESLGVELRTLDVKFLFGEDGSALTSAKNRIPTGDVNIESYEASVASAKPVWVANRNGLFLNIAACLAEQSQAQYVVPGFNKEEAATFPDNSRAFIDAMNRSLSFSTSNHVEVFCFSTEMNKSEIYAELLDGDGEVDKIWPCYFDGDEICGRCESCQLFLRAKKEGEKRHAHGFSE